MIRPTATSPRSLAVMIRAVTLAAVSQLCRRAAYVGLFAALALAGCATTNVDDAERDAEGAVVASGEVGINRLRLGDCFDRHDESDESLVEAVEGIPCGGPHDEEVYFLGVLPDEEYPGDQVAADLAAEQCIAEFESYVGIAYTDSDLDISYIYPSEDSWGDGDRGYVCSLFDVNLQQLSGSMRGAGR